MSSRFPVNRLQTFQLECLQPSPSVPRWSALLLLWMASVVAFAAETAEFVGVEEIWLGAASGSSRVLPHAISLQSAVRLPDRKRLRFLDRLEDDLLYVVRVRIKGKIFYRLVYGEYASRKEAEEAIKDIRQWFPGAWPVVRGEAELSQLQRMLSSGRRKTLSSTINPMPAALPPPGERSVDSDLGDKLLEQARQKLIDGDHDRTLRITDKVLEIGSRDQQEQALELAGIARERQKKFAQAIRLYREFLSRFPDSKRAPRIRSRLQGLLTMREEPRQKLAKKETREKTAWTYYGTFSQYYRHDTLDQQDAGAEQTGSLLSSDLDVTARRKGEDDFWQLRFNGGVINDFTDNETETRISRAEVRYQNDIADYEIIGGRQSRTISGLSGRFDGVVFTRFDPQSVDYSLFLGSPVDSSADGTDTERWFAGGGLKLRPIEHLTLDWYLYQQQSYGLTDRQATGVEWQFRTDKGFLFGSFEYDFFFSEVDHFSLVANYRTRSKWIINLNLDYRYSPILSVQNALQGQTASTLDELLASFSEDEIYDLARDRTARNQTIFLGASYSIDINRLVSLNASWSRTEATPASGGVEANPEANELQLSADYSFKGWLKSDDFATWGIRLSDSDTTSVISLQARSRIPGGKQLFYTPRLRLDHRDNKNDDVKQWILAPEVKLSYKPSRELSLEASFGFEYSNFNLPELSDQTAYSLYLSYFYQF
jgi:tetratricopeptide (TPR) repeat protein